MSLGIFTRIIGIYEGFAYETPTVSDVPLALTATVYEPADAKPAQVAVIVVENFPVRLRYDGGDPAGNDGYFIGANSGVVIYGIESIRKVRFIRATADDARLVVTYER